MRPVRWETIAAIKKAKSGDPYLLTERNGKQRKVPVDAETANAIVALRRQFEDLSIPSHPPVNI